MWEPKGVPAVQGISGFGIIKSLMVVTTYATYASASHTIARAFKLTVGLFRVEFF